MPASLADSFYHKDLSPAALLPLCGFTQDRHRIGFVKFKSRSQPWLSPLLTLGTRGHRPSWMCAPKPSPLSLLVKALTCSGNCCQHQIPLHSGWQQAIKPLELRQMWLTPERSQGPGCDVWGQLSLGPRCVFTSFSLTIQFWRWASLKGNYRLSNLLAPCLMWKTRLWQSDNFEIKQDSNCYWKKQLSKRMKDSPQRWPHPSCPVWAGSLNTRNQQALGTFGIEGDLFWERGLQKARRFPIWVAAYAPLPPGLNSSRGFSLGPEGQPAGLCHDLCTLLFPITHFCYIVQCPNYIPRRLSPFLTICVASWPRKDGTLQNS